MIRVCVCDDDISVVNKISYILDKLAVEKNIIMKIDAFYDGITLIDNVQKNNSNYDVLFLDIEMDSMNGIDAAKCLRKKDESAYIIYVSSHENYAIDTFAVRPYQFIVKPFKDELIEKFFLNIYERIISNEECFEFYYKRTYYRLLLKDIKYFESDNRSIIIKLKDGIEYKYYDKLDRVENKLKNSKLSFMRIHKSILVNSSYIAKKRYDEVELMDGEKLLISEKQRKEIGKYYMNKVEEIMRYGNDD